MSAPKKVMIGLPVYSQMFSQFSISLIHSLRKVSPHKVLIKDLIGESLIPRGRNRIAKMFLESDCTHLLFLDTDLQFHEDTIKRLLDHDKDIICGVYPKKQIKRAYVMNKQYEEVDGLLSVREAGTGAMMIARNVLERMMGMNDDEGVNGWFVAQETMEGTPDIQYDFFRTGNFNIKKDEDSKAYWEKDELPNHLQKLSGTEKKWYLSEDWYFCQRWKQMGGDIWVDTSCVFDHVGQITYPLRYKELKEATEHLEELSKKHNIPIEDA